MLYLKQFTKFPNAGDIASGQIVSRLLETPVTTTGDIPLQSPNLIAIGSIIHWADRNSIIWGAGLISKSVMLRARPAKILAVRGHLTRQRLAADGIHCPELVGDPGALISELFAFEGSPQGVGIVPHYMDLDEASVDQCLEHGAVLIDPLSPLESYLAAIASCELIISSSLHGIVFAHAFGRAAVWITFSSRVIGDGFKFLDYYSSIGFQPDEVPLLTSRDPFNRILEEARLPKTDLDLDGLRAALMSVKDDLAENVPERRLTKFDW